MKRNESVDGALVHFKIPPSFFSVDGVVLVDRTKKLSNKSGVSSLKTRSVAVGYRVVLIKLPQHLIVKIVISF